MNELIQEAEEILDRCKTVAGKREQLESDLAEAELLSKEETREMEEWERAQKLIHEAALITQQKLEYHISELVTLALESTLPDPYTFKVCFSVKRGQTECDLFFETESGDLLSPIDASGGGAVDIAALALRVSFIHLCRTPVAPMLWMDEPMKNLSKDLQQEAGEVLRELSNRLGFQFIIVTHEKAITECAQRTFQIQKVNGISEVQI